MLEIPSSFWALPTSDLLRALESRPEGLTTSEADLRSKHTRAEGLKQKQRTHWVHLLLNQFKSPLILILAAAAVLSSFLGDASDALIILGIVLVSGLLGFWQEWGAADAVQKLLALVELKARVLRDGVTREISVDEVVPGDVVLVSAGDSLPGDCRLLTSETLSMDEATLTGESFPVPKTPGDLPQETSLSGRTNGLFMGTHVLSGSAHALLCFTGKKTEFGKIAERLRLRPEETEFESGVRKFGYFLLEVTLVLVILMFAINVYLQRPMLESFLFSLALAVGLTPQLLPVIVSINLAHGARQMAAKKVIVKKLHAIENLGSMNVICSDKTGTLTEGEVHIRATLNVDGNESERVVLFAYLNASHESGYVNPIDKAIRSYRSFDISGYRKLGELPYDFNRKCLSILLDKKGSRLLVSKGALPSILNICTLVEREDGQVESIGPVRTKLLNDGEDLGRQGFRVLGIAFRTLTSDVLTREDEADLTFLGFLALYDPPRAEVKKTISELAHLGVSLKMITGDSPAVATSIARQLELPESEILSGPSLRALSDEALMNLVNRVTVFAEVEPNQKERIIVALKRAGNVVGYMGDGVNDASALYAADVGISVSGAADAAKEASDIILLEKNLAVLTGGIREGRITFANTLKYVFMATSANFGNMFSMAGVSLLLPFLPLLPKQILLTNLLTDFPEMTIATDRVDDEQVSAPHRWNIRFIRDFMLVFGCLSSVFDYLTFAALTFFLHAGPAQFRTGWFLESVTSASIIVLVIRTHGPLFRSRPSPYLLAMTGAVVALTLALPYAPLALPLGLAPLPARFLVILVAILGLYMLSAEGVKRIFYRYRKDT